MQESNILFMTRKPRKTRETFILQEDDEWDEHEEAMRDVTLSLSLEMLNSFSWTRREGFIYKYISYMDDLCGFVYELGGKMWLVLEKGLEELKIDMYTIILAFYTQ